MNRRCEGLSGYAKLPAVPEYERGMPEKHLKLYHDVARKHESFLNMAEGWIHKRPKCKTVSARTTIRKVREDFDKLYVDYAIQCDRIQGRYFMVAYTPHGIKQIDSAFGEQIRIIGTKECLFTVDELKECILRHPHLHPIIRTNLYQNLLNYAK